MKCGAQHFHGNSRPANMSFFKLVLHSVGILISGPDPGDPAPREWNLAKISCICICSQRTTTDQILYPWIIALFPYATWMLSRLQFCHIRWTASSLEHIFVDDNAIFWARLNSGTRREPYFQQCACAGKCLHQVWFTFQQGCRRRGDAGYPSPRSRNPGGISPVLFKMDSSCLPT